MLVDLFLFNQSGADEQTADCEEKVNAQEAEIMNPGIGERSDAENGRMIGDNAQHCDRAPAVECWDIPGPGRGGEVLCHENQAQDTRHLFEMA